MTKIHLNREHGQRINPEIKEGYFVGSKPITYTMSVNVNLLFLMSIMITRKINHDYHGLNKNRLKSI